MRRSSRPVITLSVLTPAAAFSVLVLIALAGGVLAAQGALAQLGLTEAAAREFLLGEIKGPAQGRTSPIAVAGTRAFYKVPPAARGAAAAGLFTWAKAYVNSAAFKAAYAQQRKDVIPTYRPDALTVDQEIEKLQRETRTGLEEMRKAAASLPPAEAAKLLAGLKDAEAQAMDPARLKIMRDAMEAERADRKAKAEASTREWEDRLPADPQALFARRLREFLAVTADADFSARTIHLTGGPDGIEFVAPVHRGKHWMWQLAVIAGRDATMAAREAAEAWLKEIER